MVSMQTSAVSIMLDSPEYLVCPSGHVYKDTMVTQETLTYIATVFVLQFRCHSLDNGIRKLQAFQA